ncbi:MAG: SAM-dependent methyltransferase, partial [Alphaproteobacteria bacterium]
MDRSVYLRMAAHEDIHWWFAARRQIVTRLIRQFATRHSAKARPEPRILEVGCGTGGNLAMLRQFGPVTAVECDKEARDLATSKSGATIV